MKIIKILLIIIIIIFLFYLMNKINYYEKFENNNLDIFIPDKNSWLNSSRNIKYNNNYLEVELKNDNDNWIYNKMEIHSLLLNQNLINKNGRLTYELDKEDDDKIMTQLFPNYNGNTIPETIVNDCVMLSVNIPKYNKIREETLNILNDYKLPKIEVFYGYTPETKFNSKFYDLMENKNQRNELALGMLEIFENFVNKYEKPNNNNTNAWLLYLEDDVRPINVDKNEVLDILYNIPINAELIRPYIGKNEKINMENMKYNISYGGGLNHAFYISVSGCKKVINYAKKHKWKYVCDIDLYKLAKHCGGFPTGNDGWNLSSVNNNNDITPLLEENEKIHMYSMSNIIFDQTSLPLAL
jgi:hypothetical protein